MKTCILLLACLIGDDPKPEATEQQGTWRGATSVRAEVAVPEDVIRSITRTVDGDRVVWKRDDKPFAATTLKLDPKADPKTIDVAPESPGQKDRVSLGIYKIEGETLTLCMADPGEPRPTKFDSPKGTKRTLMTFRREVAAPKSR